MPQALLQLVALWELGTEDAASPEDHGADAHIHAAAAGENNEALAGRPSATIEQRVACLVITQSVADNENAGGRMFEQCRAHVAVRIDDKAEALEGGAYGIA